MRLTVACWTVEGFLRDCRQFSQASRGRKLVHECPICRYRGRFLSLKHGLSGSRPGRCALPKLNSQRPLKRVGEMSCC